MKIAYFIDTIIPSYRANTVHVMKMCQALAKEGHDVTLYCDTDSNQGVTEDVWKQYGVEECFSIVSVKMPFLIRKYGHRFYNMLGARAKTKIAKDYDVAYGRSVYSLNELKNKHKYIYEAHSEPTKWTKRYEKKVLKHKNCIGLVVISKALKERYLELYPFLHDADITVLHDCADIDYSENKTVAELKQDPRKSEIKIGYLGHLYPGKCMEILIPVAEKRPEYCFHIVGGTPEWIDHWKDEIKKRGLDNIIFYGYINNADIGRYYRAFDISFLSFSKSIYIGKSQNVDIGKWISPLKLFEAMSYKKAILVSAIPTILEVITNGKDGLTADPDNLNEWLDKLDMLVTDANLRRQLGEAAFEKLKNEYTWEKRAKRISFLLENRYEYCKE